MEVNSDLKGTAEQRFMIMMNERIGCLEETLHELSTKFDEKLDALQNDKEDTTRSQFHFLVVEKQFPERSLQSDIGLEEMTEHVHGVIDGVFRNRKTFRPHFAHWMWSCRHDETDDPDDRYVSSVVVTITLCLQVPMSTPRLRELVADDTAYSVTEHAYMDYSRFLARMQYDDTMVIEPDSNEAECGTEAWLYVWINTHGPAIADPYMNDDPFTKSTNYDASKEMQLYIRDKVFPSFVNLYEVLELDRYY